MPIAVVPAGPGRRCRRSRQNRASFSGPYDDLRRYGINSLTGEACPYSQRVLCDLTPRGKKIVFDLLGIPPTIPLSENWNSGSSFSMMIPRSLLAQLRLHHGLDMCGAGHEVAFKLAQVGLQGGRGSEIGDDLLGAGRGRRC